MAGVGRPRSDAALDEIARASTAYDDAPPIVRRRFDTVAGEAMGWARAGLEALGAPKGGQPASAASLLADEIDQALGELKSLLRI